jgi:hypothetical protein
MFSRKVTQKGGERSRWAGQLTCQRVDADGHGDAAWVACGESLDPLANSAKEVVHGTVWFLESCNTAKEFDQSVSERAMAQPQLENGIHISDEYPKVWSFGERMDGAQLDGELRDCKRVDEGSQTSGRGAA